MKFKVNLKQNFSIQQKMQIFRSKKHFLSSFLIHLNKAITFFYDQNHEYKHTQTRTYVHKLH